jgi:hypothetical protein
MEDEEGDANVDISESAPSSVQSGATIRDLANPNNTGNKGTDLNRAKQIAQKLGLTNLTDDEYDIPTFIRRQQEHDI